MSSIFKAEVLRHIHWILILAVAHFLILYYLFSIGTPFVRGESLIGWILGTIFFAGIFGILQMKLHKRSNDWVYLLHRPLQPARIHLALTGAGVVLLTLAVVLPALLGVIIMQIDGGVSIERRDYQLLVMSAGLVLTTYSLAQFSVLAPGRLAFLSLALILVFIYQPHRKSEHLITHTLLMLWALVIAHMAFRADHNREAESPVKLLLMELPIVFGCYALLGMLGNIYFSASTATTGNGYSFVDFFNPERNREHLQSALERSTHPEAAFIAQQSRLGEIIAIAVPQATSYPEHQQLALRDSVVKWRIAEPDSGTTWLFNHDTMLYVGHDAGGADAGWLGPDGFYTTGMPAVRFGSVPLATANTWIVDDHHIYQVDWQKRTIHQRFTNDGIERFADSLFIGEKFATIFSSRHLFIFSAHQILDPEVTLVPEAFLEVSTTVETPFPNFHVMPLIDGYLVSDLGVTRDLIPGGLVDFVTAGKSRLQVWKVARGGAGELLVNEPRQSPYNQLALYEGFIRAPGIRIVLDAFWGWKMHRSAERTFPVLHHNFPLWVIVATALFCSFCGGLVAWLLRNSRLPASFRYFWIALCTFSGLPGLIAFLCGHYWRGRESLKLPLPVTNAAPRVAP